MFLQHHGRTKNFKPLIPHGKFNTLDINPSRLCDITGYKFVETELKNKNLEQWTLKWRCWYFTRGNCKK